MEVIVGLWLILYANYGFLNAHPTSIPCAKCQHRITNSNNEQISIESSNNQGNGQHVYNIVNSNEREARKLEHATLESIPNTDEKHETGIFQHEQEYNFKFDSDSFGSYHRDRVIWERIPNRDKHEVERNHGYKVNNLQLLDYKHEDGVHNFPHPFKWGNSDVKHHNTFSSSKMNEDKWYTPDHEKRLHNSEYEHQRNDTNNPARENNNFKEFYTYKNDHKSEAESKLHHSRIDEYINSPDCGISKGRKSNSNKAAPGQFPWIVRIAYRNKTTNRIDYRCSGSMVGFDAILTAAHCIKNLVMDLEISHVLVGDDAASPNKYDINEIVAHPDYDAPKYANDIALLRINTTISDKLPTVCLPLNSTENRLRDEFFEGSGIFAGWSATDKNGEANFVQYIKLSIVNATSCSEAYGKFSENARDPIVIRPTQLCAISEENQDVCQGDSGGPFMDDGGSGQYTVLGLVAFGLIQPAANNVACGALNFPSVYTRISAYNNWIISEMRKQIK